jgi:hypothetical protein
MAQPRIKTVIGPRTRHDTFAARSITTVIILQISISGMAGIFKRNLNIAMVFPPLLLPSLYLPG